MKYTQEFEELLKICQKNSQYVGLGNPNAKILFVGKEAALKVGTEHTDGSADSFKNNDYSISFKPNIDFEKEKKLLNYRHTWQKYQKLYELIFQKLAVEIKSKEKYEITFVENVFTTELSDLAALNTKTAKKNKDFEVNLSFRKKVFWKSNFIKQFPIVVIFASDNKYIETTKGEVCELFGVNFSHHLKCEKLGNIWVHFSKKENEIYPKLVVHTRQLTNGASNDLIDKIASIITDFIKKHSINMIVK